MWRWVYLPHMPAAKQAASKLALRSPLKSSDGKPMTRSELSLRIKKFHPHLLHRDAERIVGTIFDEISARSLAATG